MEQTIMTATKEFQWDMAHMLCNHEGLCQNLHGHTYKLQVTVSRFKEFTNETKNASDEGMIIDFSALKKIIQGNIVGALDHCVMLNINSNDPFEKCLIALATEYQKKVALVPYRPTAENMVADFWDRISMKLASEDADIKLVKLRLYETPTSYAEMEM